MQEQMNFLDMCGAPETPVIPFEEQKAGRKGWIIDISGIFLTKNGWKENAIGVQTRAVQFTEDSEKDKYGRISQTAQYIHPHDGGWCGGNKTVYAARPTLEECVAYARKKYSMPEKVLYYEKNVITERAVWNYDEGNQKL